MKPETVLDQITALGIVPVIAIEQVEAAVPLADALLEGGLPVVEITFRTAAAAEVIRKITEERPKLLVGAGTVLTTANLEAARNSGAAFAVAPGLNPQIVRQAADLGLPFIPGVATPSEIELGLAMGCKMLKFFPAEALGGVPMIEALSAPYKHTAIRFMPTGGIQPGNLESYLRVATVAAVGGTWIAKKEDLAGAQWEAIRGRCQAARAMAAKVRNYSADRQMDYK
ncbi:MAG TPA: bifunctional 4-hydroxy-2-oxoglutarate aldolase/2-dehydro-3-deoxy-phosphogluconate aldolase [Candidatus Paceibacterota bacterium]|nr:bifunctional 4-hydroxy-2-oxoglutarate aldolase/2-dehydro-3-deoxy-phosphogluconate aldolase [Verrucomicrobiota bacterium]HRY47180.1 bifunctional 4-hydroxy-2-oxoglutarate aldolase/2-dehydro-3-deoxy-phosphogluconate aldolase [Candidatus Paceibacterota bacterium]HRZ99611.1 bifunctional 4-hydroxy-2-oxoglutarate aldolase/2-dehydro-3-deoxy-phosphogluconate aldolase [Candidatus Paceibacterota bacterium]